MPEIAVFIPLELHQAKGHDRFRTPAVLLTEL
jgi:hypothetical protein